ncbi:MAG: succinate dehydrogenase, cytochrome b556 subunit [Chloroflexota bacterium]
MAVAGDVAGRKLPVRETGVWAWALQRLTAILIAVFLSTHLWVLHFARPGGGPVTLEEARERLSSPWYQTLYLLLLATAIYHSLNGVRAVLLDLGIGVRSQRLMTGILVAMGAIAFVYGAVALVPYITGQPLFR